jgi:PPOX class probable F420-dependent enzyme
MPVWFLWLDGELLVYSHRSAARNRNIDGNPRVSFHLNDDGRGEDVVSIQGIAQRDPSRPPGKDNPAYLAKYAELLREYDWTPQYFTAEYPHAIVIRPTRVRIE